jgi:deoxycytidylate deaminase
MHIKHSLTAVVFDKRGRPLSVGRNSYTKTHPIQAKAAAATGNPHRIYLHAEIDAIIKLDNPSKAYKIVVFRYDKKGNPANAKPCDACMSLINKLNLKVEHT